MQKWQDTKKQTGQDTLQKLSVYITHVNSKNSFWTKKNIILGTHSKLNIICELTQ
jgi:hypothetical protein